MTSKELTPEEEIINKRCLALARLLLRQDSHGGPAQTLVGLLVHRAFQYQDKVVKCRSVYDWFVKNKVPNELAWTFSGMDDLVHGAER